MKSRYFDPSLPRLFGHRGAAGRLPENTMASFRAAVDAGIPYLEMDVWSTRDGRAVVHHDETLERTCGLPRRLPEISWDELQEADAGCTASLDGGQTFPFRGMGMTVPLLEEVLTAFPRIFCNIEIKQADPPMEERVLEAVHRAGAMDRVLLAAEQDDIMSRLRPLCGPIPTSCSRGEIRLFLDWISSGAKGPFPTPARALQIPETYGPIRLVTKETIRAAHETGLEIHVWTVNEPEDMERLLEMGVDGLMSDFPDRLVEIAKARKYK